MNVAQPPIPLAVNFHLWPRCNLKCTFCFAGFPESRGRIPTSEALALVEMLAAVGVQKLTLVGGEPTLHPDLDKIVRHAADVGLVTCIVSNGARLLQVMDAVGDALHWVGLSVDSGDEVTQAALGRGKGDHLARSLRLADELHRRGIRLKLNSVITRLNHHEDMSELVRRMRPERWKVFQVLRVEGENDGRVEPLMISSEDFDAFVDRHAHLAAEGLAPVPEGNDAMRGSYAMVDPLGRFFSNEFGPYRVSRPINEVGVAAALGDIVWRDEKFFARGGLYDWNPQRLSSSEVVGVGGAQ